MNSAEGLPQAVVVSAFGPWEFTRGFLLMLYRTQQYRLALFVFLLCGQDISCCKK